MTALIKKRKDGRDYYYAVRSACVNGKPWIEWQKYVGPVDQVVRRHNDKYGSPSDLHIVYRVRTDNIIYDICRSS